MVDVSKYFTNILEFDEQNKTITLQPGIVRDSLNVFLKPFGLFFGPNTSTSNRCMIGGMVGNNSSGSTSIRYGVTRDKVLSIEGLLSNGSDVIFSEITSETTFQVNSYRRRGKIHNFKHFNTVAEVTGGYQIRFSSILAHCLVTYLHKLHQSICILIVIIISNCSRFPVDSQSIFF